MNAKGKQVKFFRPGSPAKIEESKTVKLTAHGKPDAPAKTVKFLPKADGKVNAAPVTKGAPKFFDPKGTSKSLKSLEKPTKKKRKDRKAEEDVQTWIQIFSYFIIALSILNVLLLLATFGVYLGRFELSGWEYSAIRRKFYLNEVKLDNESDSDSAGAATSTIDPGVTFIPVPLTTTAAPPTDFTIPQVKKHHVPTTTLSPECAELNRTIADGSFTEGADADSLDQQCAKNRACSHQIGPVEGVVECDKPLQCSSNNPSTAVPELSSHPTDGSFCGRSSVCYKSKCCPVPESYRVARLPQPGRWVYADFDDECFNGIDIEYSIHKTNESKLRCSLPRAEAIVKEKFVRLCNGRKYAGRPCVGERILELTCRERMRYERDHKLRAKISCEGIYGKLKSDEFECEAHCEQTKGTITTTDTTTFNQYFEGVPCNGGDGICLRDYHGKVDGKTPDEAIGNVRCLKKFDEDLD